MAKAKMNWDKGNSTLKAKLATKGARNPGGLAAYIAKKKQGKK